MMRRQWWTLATLSMACVAFAGCAGKKDKVAQAPAPVVSAPPALASSSAPTARPAPEGPVDEAEWFRTATVEELEARLTDVYFQYDQANLEVEARSSLEQNADWLLKPYNTLVIEVEGHCDERGTMEYNLALGDRRSGSAASYLLSRGLQRERIKTISYGKERPMCTEEREQCWWKNRRAHFRVASKGAQRSGE
jgi:peptidoglycan-associated lipoprotein